MSMHQIGYVHTYMNIGTYLDRKIEHILLISSTNSD